MIADSAARPALHLQDLTSPASHALLAQGLLLSGLAMAAAGTSRPCSGAEHLLSHALDEALGAGAALHGEQVALGALLSAEAHGSPLRARLRSVFDRLGLPVRPADLGLSVEQVCRALAAAPATRPQRWTVLSTLDLGDQRALAALVERACA